MNTLRHPALTTIAQRCLASGAVAAAGGLLLVYAQVCHGSVDEGVRWRAEQRALAHANYLSGQPSARP
jgi:putative copper export protein